MANRLISEWVAGEKLNAADLNDTFDAVDTAITTGIASEVTTRATNDGFIYQIGAFSTNSTSEVSLKTITFNKEVDSVIFSVNGTSGSSAPQEGYMKLYKGAVQLTDSTVAAMSGVRDYTNHNATLCWARGSNYILFRQSTDCGVSIYINQSFAIGDTLVIKGYTSSASYPLSIYNIEIVGVKNKSTDTTWVSVS